MLIGIDWGSTSCRALLLGDDGEILEVRSGPFGVREVTDFGACFRRLVVDWLERYDAPTLCCGMIGSDVGWVDAGYIECPAGPEELASKLVRIPYETPVFVVPGLRCDRPDVMRGEETQLVGAGLTVGRVCLPGTHSKWVELAGGRIERFATHVTGELFEVLRRHTLVGRAMEGDAPDFEAFDAAVSAASGLSADLFTVRSKAVLGELRPTAAASYLSGLLIGNEIREACPTGTEDEVTLIGDPLLTERYARALPGARRLGGTEAVARGLWRLWTLSGRNA